MLSFGPQNVLLTLCSLFQVIFYSFQQRSTEKCEPVSTNAGKYLPACITLCTLFVHSTVLKSQNLNFLSCQYCLTDVIQVHKHQQNFVKKKRKKKKGIKNKADT